MQNVGRTEVERDKSEDGYLGGVLLINRHFGIEPFSQPLPTSGKRQRVAAFVRAPYGCTPAGQPSLSHLHDSFTAYVRLYLNPTLS
jgi:hypothetical protein